MRKKEKGCDCIACAYDFNVGDLYVSNERSRPWTVIVTSVDHEDVFPGDVVIYHSVRGSQPWYPSALVGYLTHASKC